MQYMKTYDYKRPARLKHKNLVNMPDLPQSYVVNDFKKMQYVSSNTSSTRVQGEFLPMQKYFVKVKSFFIQFNLWSNTITTQVEDNWFWIVLDAANDCVLKFTCGFWVSPHCQVLQHTPTVSPLYNDYI